MPCPGAITYIRLAFADRSLQIYPMNQIPFINAIAGAPRNTNTVWMLFTGNPVTHAYYGTFEKGVLLDDLKSLAALLDIVVGKMTSPLASAWPRILLHSESPPLSCAVE